MPPPAQLPTQLSNNEDDDDDPFDFDLTDAAHNYDSEEEHGVVYNNLYPQLDPHNVDWDDEDDVEDCFDDTEVNGDFYAGMSAAELEALLHPPGVGAAMAVAAGGGGLLFPFTKQTASCVFIQNSKLNFKMKKSQPFED